MFFFNFCTQFVYSPYGNGCGARSDKKSQRRSDDVETSLQYNVSARFTRDVCDGVNYSLVCFVVRKIKLYIFFLDIVCWKRVSFFIFLFFFQMFSALFLNFFKFVMHLKGKGCKIINTYNYIIIYFRKVSFIKYFINIIFF